MRIALLSTGFLGNKEATAITITDFAKELVKQNHEVTIISERRKEAKKYEIIEGIVHFRAGKINQSNWFKKFSLFNRVLSHALGIREINKKTGGDFDIVHTFSAAPVLVLRGLFSKMFNRNGKIVHTLKSYSRESLGNSFYWLLNGISTVTVPTQEFAKKIYQKGVKKNKIRIINSHINTKRFYPEENQKLKEELKCKNKKIILYYGSTLENKGVKILTKSLEKVFKDNQDAVLIFVPRNYPFPKEYQLALDKLKEKVILVPKVEDISSYVAMADLVVLPYPNLIGTEGNPSCMLEAMACKTPVVTTNLPELKEIADGCVFMAKPGDVDSLSETIIQALDNPDKEMVDRAYQKAQEFSVEKITQQFIELYETLLNRKK